MSAKLLSSITVAVLLLAPLSSEAQLPRDPVERARIISQIMETQSRQLTLFDRQGQAVGVVGPRDLYNQPVFSPDAKRVAVIKPDLTKRRTICGSSMSPPQKAFRSRPANRAREPIRRRGRRTEARSLTLRCVMVISVSTERRRTARGQRRAPLQELGADDADRLVSGWKPSGFTDRSFGRWCTRCR